LTNAINCDRPFAVLVGKPGTGKTTLLFRLLEQYRNTARTVFVFQSQCNARELMQYMLTDADIDVSTPDIVSMHTKFNDVLIETHRSGKRFLLLLDEAHNFDERTIESIRLLSDFETPKKKLVQIIFSGQPGLDEVLAQPGMVQVRQRISLFRRLDPLSREEVGAYIAHRLKIVRATLEVFSPVSIELIAAVSGGIPREIHNLCFAALSLASAKGRSKVTGDIVYTVARDLRILSGDEKDQEENITEEAPVVVRSESDESVEPDTRDESVAIDESAERIEPLDLVEPHVASATAAVSSVAGDALPMPSAVPNITRTDTKPDFFSVQRSIVPDPADCRKHSFGTSGDRSFAQESDSDLEETGRELKANGKKILVTAAVLGIVSGCAVFAWVQGVNGKVKDFVSAPTLFANTATQAPETTEETSRKPVVAAMPRPPTKKRAVRRIASEPAEERTDLLDSASESPVSDDHADPPMAVAGIQSDQRSNDQLAIAVMPASVEVVPAPAPAPPAVSRFVPSRLVESPPPSYPSAARNARIGGQVELEAIITTRGRLRDIHVINGHPLLNAAAIEAAERQRYTPYLLNGVPQEVSTRVRFVFKP
jgi:TonB family protein